MADKNIDLTKTDPNIQSIPDCFVRVVRYRRRDTRIHELNDRKPKIIFADQEKTVKGIRHQLKGSKVTSSSIVDIASDILNCVVYKAKGSPAGRFSMTLSPGDINYHHLIHPGDHIFIWMKRRRPEVIAKGTNRNFNNDADSGLKLYGVITDVRRRFVVNRIGQKELRYQVVGKDFGYFLEADVFYNASIGDQLQDPRIFQQVTFSSSAVGVSAGGRTTSNVLYSPDIIVKAFLNAYIGTGPNGTHLGAIGRPVSENTTLFMPQGVSDTFDVQAGKDNVFTNVLRKRAGIEQYSNNPVPRMNGMEGFKFFHIDMGSKYSLWSVLQAYGNLTINEMFLDLKRDKTGKLFPTFTLRQIPFTTKKAQRAFKNSKEKLDSTAFIDLPRVIVPESFIITENTGRGDNERFNFIELIGTTPGLDDFVTIAAQTALGNYAVDTGSVKRYGLRAMIPRTDWHFPDPDKKDTERLATLVPRWINLLSDWWLGSHIYESGTIQLVGIEETLSIGDNLEVQREDGVNELYHIESYTHTYGIEKERGPKVFRTEVTVTRGQRVDEMPVYASGQINEDDIFDIGKTSTEFESTARPEQASSEEEAATERFETPEDRKKLQTKKRGTF